MKENGKKLCKEEVAGHINSYFIHVGCVGLPKSEGVSGKGRAEEVEDNVPELYEDVPGTNEVHPRLDGFRKLREMDVYRVVIDSNVSKSSGLTNISSLIVKEAFLAIIPVVTHMFNRY